MKKSILALVVFILGTSTTFAMGVTTPTIGIALDNTPHMVYKSLIDSYANMPILKAVEFPMVWQEGRMSFYISSKQNPSVKWSVLIRYNGVSDSETTQGESNLTIQGLVYDNTVWAQFKTSLSIVTDDQKLYVKIHSLDLQSRGAQSEGVDILTMIKEHMLGKWILFDNETLISENDSALGEAWLDSQELIKKIVEVFTDTDLFTMWREVSPGKYAVTLNKDIFENILALVGEAVNADDLSDIKVHGTINNDPANPVLLIERSQLDPTTIIRANWTKERFILNMTDKLIHLDSTFTFAKKLNGIGFSYKDSTKTTLDLSYFLQNFTATMRAKIVVEDDAVIRMDLKGKYFDGAGKSISVPTDVVSFDDLMQAFLELQLEKSPELKELRNNRDMYQ